MNKKITAKIEKYISDRAEAKATLNKRINQAKADAENAERAMEKATASDNENDYIKAADKKRFNESVIESCEQRIEALKKAVNVQEYEALANEINSETEKAINAAEKKAVNLISELYKIAVDLDSEIQENNQVAAKWANANGKDALTVTYTPMNSELMFLKQEMERRRFDVIHKGTQKTIYEKIPVIDRYGNTHGE